MNLPNQADLRILEQLDLHQRRREARLPTLSVLVGITPETTVIWKRWAENHARYVLLADANNPLQSWLYLWKTRNDAFSHSAKQLAGKTEHELEILLATQLTSQRLETHQIRELQQLLQVNTDVSKSLQYPLRWLLLLSTRADQTKLPALAVSCSLTSELTALNACIRVLYQLAIERPYWPVALLLEPQLYLQYTELSAESREKALVQQGVVAMHYFDEAAITAALAKAGVAAHPYAKAILSLSRLHPSAKMVESFVAIAARISARGSTVEDSDSARSHAARLPQETGQFYVISDGKLTSLKAQYSLVRAEQIPEETILQLALRLRGEWHCL